METETKRFVLSVQLSLAISVLPGMLRTLEDMAGMLVSNQTPHQPTTNSGFKTPRMLFAGLTG